MKLLFPLLVLTACHPVAPVVAEVNRVLDRHAISFAPDCATSLLTDEDTKCVRLEWGGWPFKPGQLGHTEPPHFSREPWTVYINESIRDDAEATAAVAAHEFGHVLGLPDDDVDGRLMSKHITPHAERLLATLPELLRYDDEWRQWQRRNSRPAVAADVPR